MDYIYTSIINIIGYLIRTKAKDYILNRKSNVTRGVPRIEELLRLTKNPYIYYNNIGRAAAVGVGAKLYIVRTEI